MHPTFQTLTRAPRSLAYISYLGLVHFLLCCIGDQAPKYDDQEQRELYRAHRPLHPPRKDTDEYKQVSAFCDQVEIILQTVNENEYQAATTLIEAPSEKFEKSVVFPSVGKVVGMFAGHKTALIQTDEGFYSPDYIQDAIATFSNARFIIAVGASCAFDRSKCELADVLVSKKICDLRNFKFNEKGEIINQGETIDVFAELKSIFCMDLVFEDDFVTSKNGRISNVHCGQYLSLSIDVENKHMCHKFCTVFPEAIGCDMVGGELLQFQQKRKVEGIIIIKGVAGYADEGRGKEWQFTAALAALTYAQSKLYYYQSQRSFPNVLSKLSHICNK